MQILLGQGKALWRVFKRLSGYPPRALPPPITSVPVVTAEDGEGNVIGKLTSISHQSTPTYSNAFSRVTSLSPRPIFPTQTAYIMARTPMMIECKLQQDCAPSTLGCFADSIANQTLTGTSTREQRKHPVRNHLSMSRRIPFLSQRCYQPMDSRRESKQRETEIVRRPRSI